MTTPAERAEQEAEEQGLPARVEDYIALARVLEVLGRE